jgi:ribokinase
VQTAITASEAVLLTFEPPPAVIERVMAMIRAAPDRPKLLVQPTPRVKTPQYIYEYLRITDYLIGTLRELAELVPDIYRTHGVDDSAETEPDFDGVIAPRLRALGVHNVCAVEGFECRVRSAALDLDIPRPPAAMLEDSAGARAAFAAALAYRVVTKRRQADRDDFEWATAAATTTQSFRDVAAAMPRASEVDRIVQLPLDGTTGGSA